MTPTFRVTAIWPELDGAGHPGNAGYWRFFAALIDGRLRFGETVTQDRLCALLGMSLSPLREVMTLLAADGMIDVRRRSGVTILTPDVRFVRDTFQFRGVIEREALRKFAAIVTDDWLDEMEAQHRAMIATVAAAAQPAAYADAMKRLEQALHGTFVGAFENAMVDEIYLKLCRKLNLLQLLYPKGVNQWSTTHALQEHLAILARLRHRDGTGAALELDRHLSSVMKRTLEV